MSGIKMHWACLLYYLFYAPVALAQLESVASFSADHTDEWRRQQPVGLAARGTGTDTMYVLEVDPATGKLPVDAAFTFEDLLQEDHDYGTPGADTLRTAAMLGVGSTAVSNANPVPISDAGDSVTVDGTVAATQSGTWNIGDVSGTVSLPTGASTEAKQDTGNTSLSSIDGKLTDVATETTQAANGTALSAIQTSTASIDTFTQNSAASLAAIETDADTIATRTPALGQATMANSTPVAIASDQTMPRGRSYADSVRNAYASTSVTTGAWVQLIASTAADINQIHIFDSCGQTLELGTGAAASETRKLLIPPGGLAEPVNLRIASGTRVALRAVGGNCTTGEFVMTGLN